MGFVLGDWCLCMVLVKLSLSFIVFEFDLIVRVETISCFYAPHMI